MKKNNLLLLIACLFAVFGCKNSSFSYETVANDPTGLRLYTLENGLKVYLSKNTDEPKIQTFIAVRAGSNYDPKESTGLAHYLEHMLFKGTDEIGTSDWEKEKVELEKISALYEQHRAETDPEKKKILYRKIDSVSLVASNYSIANEYDKMTSSLGTTGSNAHTWFEETIYKGKIPSNELDKWLDLESERFGQLVLRLFHTELEAVFEEFNRSQDNDYRKGFYALMDALFPSHPYGQQRTIGIAEHLKNPSLVDINNYFDKYYVPNNMAIVLVGDLDFEKTIEKVNNTFGKMKKKEVTHPTLPKEKPITAPIEREVFGPTAANVFIGFRSGGINSEDEILLTLANKVLTNGNAGLIDLHLNQQQQIQYATSSTTFLNDYGYQMFRGFPKAGQALDEVKSLILAQIEKLKKGEFDDWMIDAVVNDLKLNQIENFESSSALAKSYYEAFIHHEDWSKRVEFLGKLEKITKQDLVDFANRFYKDNYVVTYKRKGADDNVVKVENPGITPVNLNTDKSSAFLQAFNAKESEAIQPVFPDLESQIKQTQLTNGIKVSFIENEQNDLFELDIIFDMGSDHNKKLGLGVGYMRYLGTDTYTAEELKKEFYKLGISYYVRTGAEKSYVGLKGLKENLPKGLELLEHLWNNAVPNQEAYDKYVAQITKRRQDNKVRKGTILNRGLMNYAKYGENSRLRNIYSRSELLDMNPQELVDLVKDLKNYEQRIFYYGKDVGPAIAALNQHHKVAGELKQYPEATAYVEQKTGGSVFFVDYDMVQAQMLFLAKGSPLKIENMAASSLFNTYFGDIVFQEIRESKSLAYSAYSYYEDASKKEKSDYIMAFIGTQANKLPEAVDAMMELLNNMPEAEEQFNAAKEATLKQIAADRITKSNIFWTHEDFKEKGIKADDIEKMYKAIEKMTLADLKKFFDQNIKGQQYNVMVIGNKEDVDMEALSKLGEIKEMDVDYLFNYEKPKIIKQ
ncbi:pitrilysin family protein [uncultured Kordia sp.]|uniref:M16 family metallopeptidase n=1 Tax=uncultured Kordia sp. TaxID=507699 RepID=UPI002619907B|nr:M16 family metallopeptidase [uncultured Kordia sp.]